MAKSRKRGSERSFAMRVFALAQLIVAITAMATLAQTPAAGLEGTWLTEDASAKISFERCADALCGRLVWLRDPNDAETGGPIRDKNNPDPTKRNQPLLGIEIFSQIQPVGSTKWRAKAYDAENAKIYDVTLELRPPDRLALIGCGLWGMICRTEVWTRTR
jgi:uncharacterized protein (DUF2147 family)